MRPTRCRWALQGWPHCFLWDFVRYEQGRFEGGVGGGGGADCGGAEGERGGEALGGGAYGQCRRARVQLGAIAEAVRELTAKHGIAADRLVPAREGGLMRWWSRMRRKRIERGIDGWNSFSVSGLGGCLKVVHKTAGPRNVVSVDLVRLNHKSIIIMVSG